MDVQRTDLMRQKKRKRTLLIGVTLAAVILVSIGLAKLEPRTRISSSQQLWPRCEARLVDTRHWRRYIPQSSPFVGP